MKNCISFCIILCVALLLACSTNVAFSQNVGIGTTNPSQKLELATGNVKLSNSALGILLNGADRPMITRGFDPFLSGNLLGAGRWGLFMEGNRLTLGMPNVSGKGLDIAAYEENSTRTTLVTVKQDGKVNRPATGAVDLLPVFMGSINFDGTVTSGTGNFSVTISTPNFGVYSITLDGQSFDLQNYIVQVSVIHETVRINGNGATVNFSASGGKLIGRTFLSDGTSFPLSFHFIVYKLN